MVSHTYHHHHLTFSSEPEKIPENRNPYFDAPYYFLSILSLFTYLFVVRLSAWFEAKIGRKLTDRRGHISHGSIMICECKSEPSFQKWQWCHVAQIECVMTYSSIIGLLGWAHYLKFKKEREFQNFSVILFE